jgi:hypothetical protein
MTNLAVVAWNSDNRTKTASKPQLLQWILAVITSFFLELIPRWKTCSEVAEVATVCCFPSYGSEIVPVSASKSHLATTFFG